MTAAVRVDIAGVPMGVAALSALRCMLSAVFAELCFKNRDPIALSYFDRLRPTMTRERIES
jgi:hypothetical protein